MEMVATIRTELALSGLFRVVRILDENFRDDNIEEIKSLNDFIDCKIEELTREAKPDNLVLLMPSLKELQAAALDLEDQLDLYEYGQIKKQVNSSSDEPMPKEKVLPPHLSKGLDRLLEIVERVKNKKGTAQGQAKTITPTSSTLLSPYSVKDNQYDSFIDYLVDESRVARPVIKLAISDISRVIMMLGINFRGHTTYKTILEQLKDVVFYHIQKLIVNVKYDGSAQSKQLLELLHAASLILELFDPYEYGYTGKQVSSFNSILSGKFRPKIEEGPIPPRSPLRIGLKKLLTFIEQAERKRPFISSRRATKLAQADTVTPTLRNGVEKWLKFAEQVEKEHPFVASKKGTMHQQIYITTTLNTTFFPYRGLFSTTNLENVESQEDAVEIMRNHKLHLSRLIFGWTETANNTNTCKVVLETLEPDQNLGSLSIIGYSCAKFPNWMVKENWLPRLHTLELHSCRNLKIVPFLPPRLEGLHVEKCHELMQLPLVDDTLDTLYLLDCPKLLLPLAFNKSLGLRNVIIINCSSNENPLFIDMSSLTNLKLLELVGFPRLQALTNLSPTMTDLEIKDCPMLTSLGNLQRCTSLERLTIFKCPMLRKEPSSVEGVVEGDIANLLPQVRCIKTDEPLFIFELVQQQAFSSIKDLTLRDCTGLSNLEKLSSLEYLKINDCPDVELLPNLPLSLKFLWIYGCPKLKEKYEEDGPKRTTISYIPSIGIY